MNIAYQVEPMDEKIRKEGERLILQNCTETGHEPFRPNEELYEELQRKDRFHLVTVRDDGQLIGYFLGILTPNLQYRDLPLGVADSYYLAPQYRGKAGIGMFRFAEKTFRERGARIMAAGLCKGNLRSESLLRYLGFEATEEVWTRSL